MSAPSNSPASGDASDPRSGGGEPTPQPGNGSPPEAGGTPPRRDYVQRIRTDPDFAVEQVQTHQRNATKAGADLRALQEQFGPLGKYIEQGVSATVLANAVQEYQALLRDPVIAQAAQSYRTTGEVRLPQPTGQPQGETVAPEDDPYLTETERTLTKQLLEQRQELDSLRQMVSQTSQNLGTQSLSRHLGDIFTERHLTGELADKVRQGLTRKIEEWTQMGDAGRKAIADLQRPDGRKTVELLVLQELGSDGALQLAREQLLREGTARAGLATDVPSQLGTTGDEPGLTEHADVLSAIKEVRARPEVLGRG